MKAMVFFPPLDTSTRTGALAPPPEAATEAPSATAPATARRRWPADRGSSLRDCSRPSSAPTPATTSNRFSVGPVKSYCCPFRYKLFPGMARCTPIACTREISSAKELRSLVLLTARACAGKDCTSVSIFSAGSGASTMSCAVCRPRSRIFHTYAQHVNVRVGHE
jgi:hypothetical protein